MPRKSKEARSAYNKDYYARMADARRARERRRYHEEDGREKQRSYRQARLPKYAEYQRAARMRNPRGALVSQAGTRARRDGLPFGITAASLHWPTHCPVLGVELDYNYTPAGTRKIRNNSPTLDRHVNELGYVVGNVFVISHRANRIKSDATAEELAAVARYAAGELPPR